jgi:hypothetical protein
MTADKIIQAIQKAARENGGRPPGQRVLFRQLGLAQSDMWNAGFARYSDALSAAGFSAGTLNQALDRSTMLDALAQLTRRLGRFPTKGDVKVERRTNRAFPSYEAYFRLSGRSYPQLKRALFEFCSNNSKYPKVRDLLEAEVGEELNDGGGTSARSARVTGYVYLAKHGPDFKIGRSNDVARRRKELALILPDELKHVHIIETDDPEGIELYWHRRFASRRGRGEWFRLTAEDVVAFKRRRYQ